ncbi:MAG TPA: ABC transporter ATP-binding protein [Usitatibacter sp.]|nr:ABC transporter ATP-binding protein [Usitatibacter sp.]
MSSEVVISAEGLGKAYRVYNRPVDRLKQIVFGEQRRFYREIWALRDVTFQVARGETVGFLGRNGAGKSTLLQLVCGTLLPTQGRIEVAGRISALLELGSGFNPEYTGLENIYLYGALLGLTREDLDARLDRILAFADIGQFAAMPVKTYSSGMQVRLAFAVAIHVDPAILVVDEALAVGDARFAARCMTQIRRMQEDGVSILFVGHDAETTRRLCTRAFVLQDGQIVQGGDPIHVARWYLALVSADYSLDRMKEFETVSAATEAAQAQPPLPGAASPAAGEQSGALAAHVAAAANEAEALFTPAVDLLAVHETEFTSAARPPEYKLFRYGDGTARIVGCEIVDDNGTSVDTVVYGQTIHVRTVIEFHEDRDRHGFGFYIADRFGVNAIGLNTFQEKVRNEPVARGDRLVYLFSFPVHLRPGVYAISPSVPYTQEEARWMDYVENAIVFTVIDSDPKRMIFGVYLPAHRQVRVGHHASRDAARSETN